MFGDRANNVLQKIEEKIQCKSCGKFISKNDVTDSCWMCFKLTCINCRKICDRCLRTFCSKHSTEKLVWRGKTKEKIVLCDMCKKICEENL